MKVGILALQGAVQPHEEKLKKLQVTSVQVRYPEQLLDLNGIILPGGESTTMIHLLKLNQLWAPLKQFVQSKPTWGICAGSILLANKVTHPSQESFEAIEITVERNAYGRQNESFIDSLAPSELWKSFSKTPEPVEGVFIRAPRITDLGANVQIIFQHRTDPVMVKQNRCLASTFHPELTESTLVHEYFLTLCQK
jgi:pyridoxal 5'-phosphate synthase pdxT subunit